MPDPKAHGLLLRGAMVRARLRGDKLSTMRPMGRHNTVVSTGRAPSKDDWTALNWKTAEPHVVNTSWGVVNGPCVSVQTTRNLVERTALFLFPRIQPMDLIWFKSTWRTDELRSGVDGVRFAADNAFCPIADTAEAVEQWRAAEMSKQARSNKWRSSMLMPRWAARDTCTVLEVVPRRPCDLTDEEKRAEGFPLPADDPDHPGATFEEFIQALHDGKGDVMRKWMWLYKITPYGKRARP